MAAATLTTYAEGVLAEKRDGLIVLAIPHTDYRLHLVADAAAAALTSAETGDRIRGKIFAEARRVDVVHIGGRYIDPVYGRPRILQGRILATDPTANTITVHCGCPFVCRLMPAQRAEQFQAGQLVSFSIERGARFEPMG